MHDMFYSQEQYDEYQSELHGDGFSNEYQRCYFQSHLEHPTRDDHNEAARLHAQGRYVVCAEWEVCCPTTDGLIGYDWLVLQDFATLQEAQEYIGLDPDDRPEGVFLYQPPAPRLEPVAVPDFDDEIPF